MRMLLPLLVILVAPFAATAQNLISGASFDSSSDLTSNWFNLDVNKVWVQVPDLDGSSQSGSVRMRNFGDTSMGSPGTLVITCLPVDPGTLYEFIIWFNITFNFQAATGVAQILVQWQDQCGGTFLGGDVAVSSGEVGMWTQLQMVEQPPPGAGGARVSMVNLKQSGDTQVALEIFFDEVFVPEPGASTLSAAALAALLGLRALLKRR
jgi:hypothetical protein